jgi:hypothetical protein
MIATLVSLSTYFCLFHNRFHIQESENFHDMRQAPWWDLEGGSHHCTLQEDWQAYLRCYSDDSSNEDESASTLECSDTEVSTSFEHLSDAVDEYDDLPDLQSTVTDSAFGDDQLHDFDDNEFGDMPELETITDTDDKVDGHSQPENSVSDVQYDWIQNYHSDDDNAPGGSSLPTEELLDSLEGESSEQHEPAM